MGCISLINGIVIRHCNSMTNISVVIPAYQSASFILPTLQTVADQTILPAEVIVIDDGSTDNTCALIEQFAGAYPQLHVTLIRVAHKGPGAARNMGVKAATSEWVAFLDSDDLWSTDKIEVVTGMISLHPEKNFFCNNEILISPEGTRNVIDYSRLYSSGSPLPRQLYMHNLFSTSAVVCKRANVLAVNGFDEQLSSAQDYELWLRMSPSLEPFFIKAALGTYVVRQGNISTTRHFRRMVNIWKVMIRHRSKGDSTLRFLFMLFRLTLSHVAGFLKAWYKKTFRRK